MDDVTDDPSADPMTEEAAEGVETVVPDDGVEAAGATTTDPPALDLDRVASDLAAVETALARLDDGTYWTDEVTGEPIPDDVLDADPIARRAR